MHVLSAHQPWVSGGLQAAYVVSMTIMANVVGPLLAVALCQWVAGCMMAANYGCMATWGLLVVSVCQWMVLTQQGSSSTLVLQICGTDRHLLAGYDQPARAGSMMAAPLASSWAVGCGCTTASSTLGPFGCCCASNGWRSLSRAAAAATAALGSGSICITYRHLLAGYDQPARPGQQVGHWTTPSINHADSIACVGQLYYGRCSHMMRQFRQWCTTSSA
jgi:hypothetical protein